MLPGRCLKQTQPRLDAGHDGICESIGAGTARILNNASNHAAVLIGADHRITSEISDSVGHHDKDSSRESTEGNVVGSRPRHLWFDHDLELDAPGQRC